MKSKDKKMVAKALTVVTNNVLSVVANSRCALIYHQPKQPETLKNFVSSNYGKVAKVLADYVIRKGMVDEENRNIYEYGLQ